MTAQITIEDADGRVVCDRCTVADRPLARLRGLLGRRELPAGEGLLLRPTPSIHTWFMRFPIDAVFVGKGADATAPKSVLSVHRGLRPWTGLVPMIRGAEGVLELPVGTIERTGTAVGDAVVLETLPE